MYVGIILGEQKNEKAMKIQASPPRGIAPGIYE